MKIFFLFDFCKDVLLNEILNFLLNLITHAQQYY